MYWKLIKPTNTPTLEMPYISVNRSNTKPRSMKYGATTQARTKLSNTVNQNVRHGLQLNGLKFKGSTITSVNSQPNM